MLHLLALYESQSISTIPPYEELKVPFLIDKYNKTPLHYLIAHEQVDYHMINVIFEYILDFLEDEERTTSYQFQAITDSLSPIFLFIINKMNSGLVKRYLKLCFSPCPTVHGQILPRFGKPFIRYSFARAPVLQPEILSSIYETGQDQINFKALMLKFDYDIRSDDMFKCVVIFSQMNNEEFFKSGAISHLIDHLWRSSKTFMKRMAVIYTVLILLVSAYIGVGQGILPLEIIILVLTSFFIIVESVQLYTLKLDYFTSIWNWADLIYFVLTFTSIISRFANFSGDLAKNWMYSGIIISGYIRWISYLRLFVSTSKF